MNIPKHVAIIMDGNGRWARNQGKDRSFGHKNGIKPLRECLKSSLNLGIKYLTIYSFSSENWNRPQDEIDALMDLLGRAIIEESDMLIENEVKIKIIGDLDKLPSETRESVESIMEVTKNFNRLTLVVGLSYSSRWEITEAVKLITKDTKEGKLKEEEINEELISSYLQTKDFPDPDLLIRSGGEKRISNFLLWQISYSELYFTDTLWPDINSEEFEKAIAYFGNKERRFGKTSAQIQTK